MFDAFRKYISQLISLDDEEWLKILACVKVKQLKKHDRLLEPHEVCRHIAFVMDDTTSRNGKTLKWLEGIIQEFNSEGKITHVYACFSNQAEWDAFIDGKL